MDDEWVFLGIWGDFISHEVAPQQSSATLKSRYKVNKELPDSQKKLHQIYTCVLFESKIKKTSNFRHQVKVLVINLTQGDAAISKAL